MLPTDSAAAILPGPAPDKLSGKGGKPADDGGAFSQEFEKQVNKSRDSAAEPERKAVSPEQPKRPDTDARETATAKKAAPAAAGQAKAGEEKGAAGDGESGKLLPPRLAAEAQQKAVADDALTTDPAGVTAEAGQAEPVAAEQLPSLVGKQDKTVADLLKGQDKARPEDDKGDADTTSALPAAILPVIPPVPADASPLAADGEALVSDGRVQDVLAQRMLGGNGQDNAALAGKQARAEIANLASLQGAKGQPQQGGFDEVLKMGASPSIGGASQGSAPAAPQPAAASVPVSMTLGMPVQQPGWDKAMAERVVWMARGNIQQAQIHLNPRELGPIDIKISMQHDQTHVNFVAHHMATRDAIEAAIPRLRDMMNEQGLNLGQADVSHHSFGDSSRQAAAANGGHGHGSGAGGPLDEEVAEDALVTRHVGHVSASGVDYFA